MTERKSKASSSRATRSSPQREVSATSATHAREQLSTTVRM